MEKVTIKHRKKKKSLLKRLRNYLFTGIALIGPLMLTVFIIVWMVSLVDSAVLMIFRLVQGDKVTKIANVPGFGVLVVVVLLILVGMLGTNFFGRYFRFIGSFIIDKIPLIKPIYGTIKQIFDTIFSKDGKAFQSVVLIQFPNSESWSLGFVTSSGEHNADITKLIKAKESTLQQHEEIQGRQGQNFISVFVPTTPNPTSGFLLYTTEDKVIHLDIAPNTAMKVIISGGSISAQDIKNAEKVNPKP